MFSSIAFYIGEKVLGLNDREYPLGELTAEVLNISPEEYQELHRTMGRAMENMDRYEKNRQMQDWFNAAPRIPDPAQIFSLDSRKPGGTL